MASPDAKLFLQSLGDPLADRTLLMASCAPNLMDQALGQFDGEDFFAFRNG